MVEYPSGDEVIQLNRKILKEIRVKKADQHRVLSKAVIHGAITAAKQDPGDLYAKAATLLVELVTRHGFDSGNRRTAYAAARLFLERNGQHPSIKHDPNVLQGIREGFYSKKQVIDWLKGHALPAFERAKPIPDNGG